MRSIWRRLSLTTKVLAGVGLLGAILSFLGSLLSPVIQTHLNRSELKSAKAAPSLIEANTTPGATHTDAVPQSPSGPKKITHNASTHPQVSTRKPVSTEPVSTMNAAETAKTREIILKKQETWLENHPGIIARYRVGQADKAEIELAINELEVIERLASNVGDNSAEQWSDQKKLQLQLIDVPSLRSRNQY